MFRLFFLIYRVTHKGWDCKDDPKIFEALFLVPAFNWVFWSYTKWPVFGKPPGPPSPSVLGLIHYIFKQYLKQYNFYFNFVNYFSFPCFTCFVSSPLVPPGSRDLIQDMPAHHRYSFHSSRPQAHPRYDDI